MVRPVVLFGIGLSILGWVAWSQGEGFWSALHDLHFPIALASLALLSGANLCIAIQFASLARRAGADQIADAELTGSYLVSQAAKYVPGKIWGVVMQSVYLRKRAGNSALIVANVETAAVAILVTSVVGASLKIGLGTNSIIGILALGGGILVVHRLMVGGAARRLVLRMLRWVRNDRLPREDAPHPGSWRVTDARMLAVLVAFTTMYVGGWALLCGPAIRLDWEQALQLVAVMSLSYAIGAVSLVPAGLGVRELAMVLLGSIGHVDPGLMASMALLSRAMLVAVDLAGTLVGGGLLAVAGRQRVRS